MKLTAFRVEKFKCVRDSGWVQIHPLTALIGKNESGKTTLLTALHKFNPFRPAPYLPEREWPRGDRRNRRDTQPVCTCRFEFNREEQEDLRGLLGREAGFSVVEISRDYGGRLAIHLPKQLYAAPPNSHPSLHPEGNGAPIRRPEAPAADRTPTAPGGEPLRSAAAAIQEPAEAPVRTGFWAFADRFSGQPRANRDQATSLIEVAPSGATTLVADAAEPGVAAALAPAPVAEPEPASFRPLAELPEPQGLRERLEQYVVSRLPTFVYMSDYQMFSGSANLEQVRQRREKGELEDADRTLLTILELSGLDLDDEVRSGALPDREQRQYDLDDAAATLTQTVAQRWHQQRYEVQFRADGHQFYTFVRDEQVPSLIRLEERSKGFQWFLSFDLMLMHESRGTFRDCVILLDEPGLHLHPQAQKDLLQRLNEYAQDNTIIYTTHLPYMIDLQTPERIRVLWEGQNGIAVSDDLGCCPTESKYVLQAALGMSGSASLLAARKNVVVAGIHDQWLITALSDWFRRFGPESLPDDANITTAGSLEQAVHIAAYVAGNGLKVVALFESSLEGDHARSVLLQQWGGGYEDRQLAALSLGATVGVYDRAFGVEDLFDEPYYMAKVREVYRKDLVAAGVREVKDLRTSSNTGEPLWRRVERALGEYGIQFSREAVASAIRTELIRATSLHHLNGEARERTRRLLAAVAKALANPEEATALPS